MPAHDVRDATLIYKAPMTESLLVKLICEELHGLEWL